MEKVTIYKFRMFLNTGSYKYPFQEKPKNAVLSWYFSIILIVALLKDIQKDCIYTHPYVHCSHAAMHQELTCKLNIEQGMILRR